MEEKKKNKKIMSGTVVSDVGDKTLVVLVDRYLKHPKYGKHVKKSKKYKVHDESNTHKVGDKVEIESCRPVSKYKAFRVKE